MATHKLIIDAKGRPLGRVASEAAKALMGKTHASYTPNVFSDVKVTVQNASKLKMRERKLKTKIYQNYSGYPSGQRKETLENLNTRKGPGAAVRLAVTRMLPKNNLRPRRLKNLIIEN